MEKLKNQSEIEVVTKEFLKNIGINHPGVKIMTQEAIMDLTVGVYFTIPVDRFMTTNKPFMPFFRDLQSDILSSPLVQDALHVEQEKTRMANVACDELMARIKELEQYKTHYELEMKLRHGEQK